MLIEQFGAIQEIYILYLYKDHLQSMLPVPKELINSYKLIYTWEEDLQKWKTIFCGFFFLAVNAGRKPLFFWICNFMPRCSADVYLNHLNLSFLFQTHLVLRNDPWVTAYIKS